MLYKRFVRCLALFISFAGCSSIFAQQIERPPITGVAHISVKVSDLSKSLKFYKDFLGYEEAFTMYNPDGSIFLAFMKVNDRQYIELTPTLKPGEADRLNHYCFETTNLPQLRDYLRSKAITVPDSLTIGRDKNLHIMIKDPDGHNVEFVQMVPGSLHDKAKGKFLYDKRISDRMTHIGITVKNADKANKFYHDILGLSEIWRGGGTDSMPSWINMRVPDGTDYIEYMMVYDEPTPERLHSAHHLCLVVPSMQKALETLRERPDISPWSFSGNHDRNIFIRL